MRIENEKVILKKGWAAFSLCYDLQKIAGCAEDDSEQLIEYQHAFSGGVSLLDLSPNDFNILMQLVRGKPSEADRAFRAVGFGRKGGAGQWRLNQRCLKNRKNGPRT